MRNLIGAAAGKLFGGSASVPGATATTGTGTAGTASTSAATGSAAAPAASSATAAPAATSTASAAPAATGGVTKTAAVGAANVVAATGSTTAGVGSAGKAGALSFLGAAKLGGATITAKLLSVVALIVVLPIASVLMIGAALKSKGEQPELIPALPSKGRKLKLARLISQNSVLILLALVTFGLLGLSGWYAYNALRTYDVVIAAGDAKAESFIMMQALQTVAARYNPRIKIRVLETGGTGDSLQRLDKGQAQLVAAQADVPAGPNARTVANLFDDAFQLVVHQNSPIAHFADLKGKKIGLPTSGGQYQSFLFLAHHFGLQQKDFTFIGGDDESADVAFAHAEADAAFRVRALHNQAITLLVTNSGGTLIPIDDGAALRVESPALSPSTIPKGIYQGNPPVPPADVPTVSLKRLLLARENVNDYVVYSLTEILLDRKQELAAAMPAANAAVRPLVAMISRPSTQAVLDAPLHPGALKFYNHDFTPFVVAHADLVGLILAAFVLIGLWVAELRHASRKVQKARADFYIRRVQPLLEELQDPAPDMDLPAYRKRLNAILLEAINALEEDKISEDSFRCFQGVWQLAMGLAQDKPVFAPAVGTAEGTSLQPRMGRKWELSRYLHQKSS